MHGRYGTGRRARIIRAEFTAGGCTCAALGILTLIRGNGWWIAIGVWLVGVGANYVPLAREARRLSGPSALTEAIQGRDLDQELHHAARAQLWIAVPFALCFAALVTAGSGA